MTTKSFDAVKLMRELRDQLSREMAQMSPEERMRYIRDRAEQTDLWRRMTADDEDSAPDTGAAGKPPLGR